VLDLSLSVGSALPVPMTACMVSAVDAVDLSSCSVVMYDKNTAGHSIAAGSSLRFKAAVDPSCTPARVHSRLCSACTAAAATAGKCPPGAHIFILDIEGPAGFEASTLLSMVFRVGASLLSAEVMIKFEVLPDSRGLDGAASRAHESLKSLFAASKFRFVGGFTFPAILGQGTQCCHLFSHLWLSLPSLLEKSIHDNAARGSLFSLITTVLASRPCYIVRSLLMHPSLLR
jgi:hypothetical protein